MFHTQPRGLIATTPGQDERTTLSPGVRQVARALRRHSLAPLEFGLLAAAVDAWLTATALLVAAPGAAGALLPAALLAGLCAAGAVALFGGYGIPRLRRTIPGAVTVLAAAIPACLLLGPETDWRTLATTLAIALGAGRLLLSTLAGWIIGFGLAERRAIVVGGGIPAARLIDGLAANPRNDIRICAIFDDRSEDRSPAMVTGVPKIGTTQDLLPFAREAEIDMIIVALPLTAEARIRQILRPLEVLPLDVRLSAYSADMTFPRKGAHGGDSALLTLLSSPLAAWDRVMKRTLDLVGATLAILLFALPMAVIAVAIRWDSPGPILFRQPRHGYNHRTITVWKFRTMRQETCDAAARQIVTRNDDRVTRVGRFLRRTSLDEIPQFFNVLRGDLSLVGPRPHALLALSSRQMAFAEMVDGYAARHRMRPGVTGWAQVNGWRGEVDEPEKLARRFEHDLYYIENWSIWLDLKILLLTPLNVVEGRNAY